jgi:uncharacterized protein YpuA (DUF1002 family)
MAKLIVSEEYLVRAKSLTKAESERLLSRMGKKIGRGLNDNKIIPIEALALQLEKEDDDLNEWRNQFAEIRSKYLKEIKASSI